MVGNLVYFVYFCCLLVYFWYFLSLYIYFWYYWYFRYVL